MEGENLKEKLDRIERLLDEGGSRKPAKPFKIPMRAKVNKRLLRKGYVTVQVIDENRNVEMRREPIVDSTIYVDGAYHAIEDFDVFYHKGKPMVYLPKEKLNPWNPLTPGNETYGQKYILAKLEEDKLKTRKALGFGAILLGVVVIIGIIYVVATGGFGG